MTPAEIALMSAQAVVAQLEAIVLAERVGVDRDVPDGMVLKCPACESLSVKQLEKNFDEQWRIKCLACEKVFAEPTVETPADGAH